MRERDTGMIRRWTPTLISQGHFLSDIDGDFKTWLAKLVPLLLAPERLVEKEIGGNKVTCRDLLEYFKVLRISFNACMVSCLATGSGHGQH